MIMFLQLCSISFIRSFIFLIKKLALCPLFTVPPTFLKTAVPIRIASTAMVDLVPAGSSSLIVVPHVGIRISDAVGHQTVPLIFFPLAG